MKGFLEDVILSLKAKGFILYCSTSKRQSACKMDYNTLNWVAEYRPHWKKCQAISEFDFRDYCFQDIFSLKA